MLPGRDDSHRFFHLTPQFEPIHAAAARDSPQKANGVVSFSVFLIRAAPAITLNTTVQRTEPHLGWRARSMPERGPDSTPEDGRKDTLA